MDNFIVFAKSAELVDVTAWEGATGEGTWRVVHGSQLLDSVANDVVSLAAVGKILVIQIATEHIDVSIIEADWVGRTAIF